MYNGWSQLYVCDLHTPLESAGLTQSLSGLTQTAYSPHTPLILSAQLSSSLSLFSFLSLYHTLSPFFSHSHPLSASLPHSLFRSLFLSPSNPPSFSPGCSWPRHHVHRGV